MERLFGLFLIGSLFIFGCGVKSPVGSGELVEYGNKQYGVDAQSKSLLIRPPQPGAASARGVASSSSAGYYGNSGYQGSYGILDKYAGWAFQYGISTVGLIQISTQAYVNYFNWNYDFYNQSYPQNGQQNNNMEFLVSTSTSPQKSYRMYLNYQGAEATWQRHASETATSLKGKLYGNSGQSFVEALFAIESAPVGSRSLQLAIYGSNINYLQGGYTSPSTIVSPVVSITEVNTSNWNGPGSTPVVKSGTVNGINGGVYQLFLYNR